MNSSRKVTQTFSFSSGSGTGAALLLEHFSSNAPLDIYPFLNYHSFMNSNSEMGQTESQGRTSRKRTRTRADLLAAARKIFAARGYHEASIAEITQAADIGVGTFYLHFHDKDEIFTTLIEEGLKDIREQVTALALQQPDEHRLSAIVRLTFHLRKWRRSYCLPPSSKSTHHALHPALP